MAGLADLISNEIGAKVINQTKVEGEFDFTIYLNNSKFPRQVKLDLAQIDLDLILIG